jgi:2-polyprenyl-6-hydroxyphenyl methylase / 3-demethylubiquinone-9 3-methyltransferase
MTQRNDLTIYDRYAAHWWDGSQRWLRTLQNIVPARLKYFDWEVKWPGKTVLDLGCGGGFMSEALAARGAIVTGVDPAAGAIAIAKQHAGEQGYSINYLVAAGESLPLEDHSIDCVVCVDVLEHVADLGAVLDEVKRVLKPGGKFLFDTINRTMLATLFVVHFGETILRLLPKGTHDPAMFIPPNRLREMLSVRGFSNIKMSGFGPRGINSKFDVTFGRMPMLSVMYIGHATLKDWR